MNTALETETRDSNLKRVDTYLISSRSSLRMEFVNETDSVGGSDIRGYAKYSVSKENIIIPSVSAFDIISRFRPKTLPWFAVNEIYRCSRWKTF